MQGTQIPSHRTAKEYADRGVAAFLFVMSVVKQMELVSRKIEGRKDIAKDHRTKWNGIKTEIKTLIQHIRRFSVDTENLLNVVKDRLASTNEQNNSLGACFRGFEASVTEGKAKQLQTECNALNTRIKEFREEFAEAYPPEEAKNGAMMKGLFYVAVGVSCIVGIFTFGAGAVVLGAIGGLSLLEALYVFFTKSEIEQINQWLKDIEGNLGKLWTSLDDVRSSAATFTDRNDRTESSKYICNVLEACQRLKKACDESSLDYNVNEGGCNIL